MTTEQTTLQLEELFMLYSQRQLWKPSLQRAKRWTDAQSQTFIHFVVDLHNLITPFLLNKAIVDGKELYSVIDGNNRINAILQFYQHPLRFLETSLVEKLKVAYPDALYRVLERMSYRQWLVTTSLSECCRQQVESEQVVFDAFQWYNEHNDRAGQIEHAYRAVHTALVRSRFDQVKAPVVIFRGMTEEKIIQIFAAVNTTGVRLTEQEIVKAISSLTLYTVDDPIPHFAAIHQTQRQFLTAQHDQEMLRELVQPVGGGGMALSTHDFLFGLQLWLNEKYPWAISRPGQTDDLDVLFKFYKLLYEGRFDEKDTVRMRDFVLRTTQYCELIDGIFRQMYGLYPYSESNIRLTQNRTVILFAYLHQDSDRQRPRQDWVRLLFYNETVGFLADLRRKHLLSEEVVVGYSSQNPLSVGSGHTEKAFRRILKSRRGGVVDDHGGNRMETGEDEEEEENKHVAVAGATATVATATFPSATLIREALTQCIQSHVSPTEFAGRKRSRPTKFECFVLSSYFYRYLPPHVTALPLESDHVFPFATDGWTGPLDIHRVGNKMLINARVNLKKSNHAVTDTFIAEHKLMYFNYPVQEIYQQILPTITPHVPHLLRHDLYNDWCARREAAYVDGIVEFVESDTK